MKAVQSYLLRKRSSEGLKEWVLDCGGGSAATSEIYLTREYIVSREILSHIAQRYGVKEHYQSSHNDLLSRLKKRPSQEEFLSYYRQMVKAVVSPETYEIVVTASAFSPEAARRLLTEIITEAKQFVNKVSNTLARKQYRFAKLNLGLAKEKLFQTNKDVLKWQNQNGLFDPKETAQVVSTVMAKLKETLVEKQTEYITYSAFMQPNSNKVLTLREEIKALKEQIEKQTSLLLGNKEKNGKLNKIMTDFEWLQLQSKFAQAEYQAAQQAYDMAAINLSKNQNLLILIESPNLPDEASKPLPFFDLVNLLFLLLILFVLTKMAIIIIKEHRDW